MAKSGTATRERDTVTRVWGRGTRGHGDMGLVGTRDQGCGDVISGKWGNGIGDAGT